MHIDELTEAQQTASLLEAKDVTIAELRELCAKQDALLDEAEQMLRRKFREVLHGVALGFILGIAATLVVGAVL